MKNVKQLMRIRDALKSENIETWIEQLTFFRIFFLWTFIIILFGMFYHFFVNGAGSLVYTVNHKPVLSLYDSIYFSFITATTTGFGDIIPIGLFKIVAILEVVFGLILLAIVTSKLIAIKQNTILSEIYEISFNERVNRLRSSLLLFRQDITRIINKIEDNTLPRREFNDIHAYFIPFEDALGETYFLLERATKSSFVKSIDPLNTELILNSVLSSFEKINELMSLVFDKKLDGRKETSISVLGRCMLITEKVFNDAKMTKEIGEKKFIDLENQKKEMLETLKKNLERWQKTG